MAVITGTNTMNSVDIFYLLSAICLAMSAISYFVYKKSWLSFALFGFAFIILAIKDIAQSNETFGLMLDIAIAAVFIFKAVESYKKTALRGK